MGFNTPPNVVKEWWMVVVDGVVCDARGVLYMHEGHKLGCKLCPELTQAAIPLSNQSKKKGAADL
jgi:hypothetical protein